MSSGFEVILDLGFTKFGILCLVGAQFHHSWLLLVYQSSDGLFV